MAGGPPPRFNSTASLRPSPLTLIVKGPSVKGMQNDKGHFPMTQRAQIRCINKQPRMDAHHAITHVGGGDAGNSWKIPQADAIAHIVNRTWSFYTVGRDGRVAEVTVATHNGHRYLKTVNDNDKPDNLLSLPECVW